MIHCRVMVGRRQILRGLPRLKERALRGAMAIAYPQEGSERPTAEVASSAIAKTPEASDEASRTAEMNDQSRNVTWNQRHAGLHMPLAAPIAKIDEAGTQPNGRNALPKPECSLESMRCRIAHVAGRPIAKTGGT